MSRIIRAGWETNYAAQGYAEDTTGESLYVDGVNKARPWADASDGIPVTTKGATTACLMDLPTRPNLGSGQNVNEIRRASGRAVPSVDAGRCYDYWLGTMLPTTTWEFSCNAYNLPLYLWAFFQSGARETVGAAYAMEFYPYSQDLVAAQYAAKSFSNFWMDLLKVNGTGVPYSEVIYSAIASALSFTCDENSLLSVSATLNGAEYVADADVEATTSHPWLAWADLAHLKWQNATVYIDDTQVWIPNYTLNLNKNVTAHTYGSAFVKRFVNGTMAGDGSLRLSYGDQWASGILGNGETAASILLGNPAGTLDPHRLTIYWGANELADTVGDVAINANFILLDAPSPDEADDETVNELSFACVQVGAARYQRAFGIGCADGQQRGMLAP